MQRAAFFQPAQYAQGKLSSVNEIYDQSYHLEIEDFFSRLSQESARHLQELLVPFFNNLEAGFLPLHDKERFYILRAIARIQDRYQQFFVLAYAAELSAGRLDYEIVDALCTLNRGAYRDRLVGFPNTNKCADVEQPIQNRDLQRHIYEALHLIGARDERRVLARYFLVRDEEGKAALAQSIKDGIRATGTFTIETDLGQPLQFHGRTSVEAPRVRFGAPL